MHSVFFGVKRTYWLGIALQQGLLQQADFWITPARFDLLYVLKMNPEGISRYRLTLLLGVSGPVLSRMMGALEREGLLERRRSYRDKRCVSVHATENGNFLVEGALRGLAEPESVEAWLRRCFGSSDERWRGEVELLERFCERARFVLYDKTPARHPWEGVPIVSADGTQQCLRMPPSTAASIAELGIAA